MTDFDIFSPGNIFDSRDVIERWDEVSAEHDALQEAIDNAAGKVEEWQEALANAKRDAEFAETALENALGSGDDEEISTAESERDDADDEVTRLERELAENEETLKDAETAMEEWTGYEEYAALKDFVESASGYGDWDHGETFIADSYFEEYAEELAEDICGKAVREAEWPFNHIDWEAAAEQLKQDYTSYELPGNGGNTVTYWARS